MPKEIKPDIETLETGAIEDGLDRRDYKIEDIFGSPKEIGTLNIPQEFNVLENQPVKYQNGVPSCFHGYTPILTENFSYKKIMNITIGDRVFTHKGNLKEVIGTFKRKWQGTTKKIKVWGDYRKIECTPEHPFYAIKRPKNLKVKRLKAIKEMPDFYPISELTEFDWIGMPFNSISKDLTIYSFEKDPDFLWLLGLYLAEGSIHNAETVLSLHKKEIIWLPRIKKVIGKYGGKVTHYFHRENSLTISIQGYKWTKIFEELGSKLCQNKKINDRLMFLTPSLQMNIVQGFADGDGYITSKRTTLVSTSYKLLLQIRTILLRNKKYSSFQKRKYISGKKQVWVLDYSLTKEPRYSFIKDGYCFALIKNIKYIKSYAGGFVYNLEVGDDNSYLVNGLSVHNCVAQATALTKQLDEGKELSARGVYLKCKELDGNANWGTSFRQAQKVMIQFGVPEEILFPEDHSKGTAHYINPEFWTEKIKVNAKEHANESYYSIGKKVTLGSSYFQTAITAMFKFQEPFVTGCMWYSDYNNMSDRDWIMPNPIGRKIGGHGYVGKGVKIIRGQRCIIMQNSYGNWWGDKGDFYVNEEHFNKHAYLGWIHIDLPKNLPIDRRYFPMDNKYYKKENTGWRPWNKYLQEQAMLAYWTTRLRHMPSTREIIGSVYGYYPKEALWQNSVGDAWLYIQFPTYLKWQKEGTLQKNLARVKELNQNSNWNGKI